MSLTAILYDSGLFSEVSVDGEGLAQTLAIRKVLGAGKVVEVSCSAFVRPFTVFVGGFGDHRHPPTALVVDLEAPTGTNTLFGPALLLRRSGTALASVREGDLERARTLPWWLRFDRLSRRMAIPNPADHGGFEPQIVLTVNGSKRPRDVVVNALVAHLEHDIVAVETRPLGMATTVLKLMVRPHVVDIARAFISSAIDGKGRPQGPWAQIR